MDLRKIYNFIGQILFFTISTFSKEPISDENCIVPSFDKHNFTCLGKVGEHYSCKFKHPSLKIILEDKFENYTCETYKYSKNCTFIEEFIEPIKSKFLRVKIIENNIVSKFCIEYYKTVLFDFIVNERNIEMDNINVMVLFESFPMPFLDNSYELIYTCNEAEAYNVSLFNTNSNNFKIENLPYPNYKYSINFKIRYKGSQYWQEYTKTFLTKSTSPVKIPKYFEFREKNGKIVLYWESIEKKYQNGDGFYYKIFFEDEIKFENCLSSNLTLIKDSKVSKFYLRTCNNLGCSKDKSILKYSPRNKKFEMKVFRSTTNLKYLFYSKNVIPDEIIFVSKYENGSINFRKESQKGKTFSISQSLQNEIWFGVAAKIKDYSTGIIWEESCPRITKYPTITEQINLKSIQIFFEDLECHIADIDYITLEISNRKFKYLDSELAFRNSIAIDKLIPFTTYNLKISFYNSTFSFYSISKNITTLENFKNPPKNLKVIQVSSSSIKLSWDTPAEVNSSRISKYIVSWNGTKHDTNFTNFEIVSLKCNEIYEISVSYDKQIGKSSKHISKIKECPNHGENYLLTANLEIVEYLAITIFVIIVLTFFIIRIRKCYKIEVRLPDQLVDYKLVEPPKV